MRFAVPLWILIQALYLVSVYFTFRSLPENLAYAFRDGSPIAWMSNSHASAFFLGMGCLVPAGVLAMHAMMAWLIGRLIPTEFPLERRMNLKAQYRQALNSLAGLLSIAVLCFFGSLVVEFWLANRKAPPSLGRPLLLVPSLIFLLGLFVWTISVLRTMTKMK